eukprot:124004_1
MKVFRTANRLYRPSLHSMCFRQLSSDIPKLTEDKLLFTPGPLTTSLGVKEAMLHDFGSRDQNFMDVISEIKSGILKIAGVSESEYACVLLQGSGTYAVEAMLTSTIPQDKGRVLVLANGAYGTRASQILKAAGIDFRLLEYPEDQTVDLDDVSRVLTSNWDITDVFCVHSETTSGIVNPITDIGRVVARHKRRFLVDAMSSFGCLEADFREAEIDYLVSSANKCLQGVPGFAFCVARKDLLLDTKGNSKSVVLDMYAQDQALSQTGQFRFTPPTHALVAFRQALVELDTEGGVNARRQRYQKNRDICVERMQKMGFELYLKERDAGPIITSFRYPKSSNWDFAKFYNELSNLGFLIYPGKVSNADCFRIGHIGAVFPQDTERLMDAVEKVVTELCVFDQKSSENMETRAKH